MSEAESEKNGGKERSERSGTEYPSFGLSLGITVIEAVRRAGGNEAPSADVMKEMGIDKVTDRKWAYGIPAAKQFGLVERVGRGDAGRIKLTDLGQRVALPGPGEEKLSKVTALRAPPLYAKLLERYAGHPVPPKEGLKNILHREYDIVESMAPGAAEAFIDSLHTAGVVNEQNLILIDGAPSQAKAAITPPPKDEALATPAGQKPVHVPEDFVVYRCKISKGRVLELPLPRDFTKRDAEKIYDFIKTQTDDEGEEAPA
jgi:hypothetical protein